MFLTCSFPFNYPYLNGYILIFFSSRDGEAEPTTEGSTQEPAADAPEQPQEEEIDIDLNDPEVEKAAIKIQSSFKGFKTRKDMSAKKEDSSPVRM